MNTPCNLNNKYRVISLLFIATLSILPNLIRAQNSSIELYPYLYDLRPEISSPQYINDTVETILVITKDKKLWYCSRNNRKRRSISLQLQNWNIVGQRQTKAN